MVSGVDISGRGGDQHAMARRALIFKCPEWVVPRVADFTLSNTRLQKILELGMKGAYQL